jgi:amino acid adenylation domain-containing protein
MSLDKSNIQDILALSPMQEGMLYLYLQDTQGRDYIETFSMLLEGELDIPTLRSAWQRVVAANEALRACFVWEQVKRPMQVVLKEHTPPFLVLKAEDAGSPPVFDLADVPLRLELRRTVTGDFHLSIHYHHILMDGWSLGIVVNELFSLYRDLKRGQTPKIAAKTPVRQYIQFLGRKDHTAHLDYWRDELAGLEPGIPLRAAVKAPVGTKSSAAGEWSVLVPPPLKWEIEILARNCQTTPATVFYCVWGLLLQRYCRHNDILFGTTVSGRPPEIPGIGHMVGLFINTLPFRMPLEIGDRYIVFDLIKTTGRRLREREAHETASLAEIGAAFDTLVVVENYPLREVLPLIRDCGLKATEPSMRERTHYDLTLGVTLRESIQLDLLYNEDLFEGRVVERMAGHLLNLLEQMSSSPQSALAGLDILSPGERRRLLHCFNDTAADLPASETIVSIFLRRVGDIPDSIAAVCDDHLLTYGELLRQTEHLAARIKKQDVTEGSIIAVMAERSLPMIIAVLGIFHAGYAYVPLEPSMPDQRIETVLNDCACRIMVLDKKRPLPSGAVTRSSIIVPAEGFAGQKEVAYSYTNGLEPEAPAYVIFTSGSTGIPKGVLVPHRAVMNRMRWVRERYELNCRDVVLQATAFIFDVSVCELFRWILPGARLCFLPSGAANDPALILRTINRFQITTIDFVPSMVGYLLDRLEQRNDAADAVSLRWVFTGVEKVATELVKRFNRILHHRTRARLINAYGPTESTVDITCFDCSVIDEDFQGIIPIGTPMANVTIDMVDPLGRLQPIGVAGELRVGGKGLALGYLNRPELTAQAFAPLYHTGDLALWLEDGAIEFIGRRDRQVKIRGHRVELEEIEQAFLALAGVAEAAVLTRRENGGQLVPIAYVTLKNQCVYDKDDLLEHLKLRLPHYMIPASLTIMGALPRTPAGKVDRNAFPPPEIRTVIPTAETPPQTRMEASLADIWQDVLGLEPGRLDIDDDFFTLGGHSLKATALSGQVLRRLKLELPVTAVFQHPTIRRLARFLEGTAHNGAGTIQPGEILNYYPLSAAQKRLYILQTMEETRTSYNMFQAVVLKGKVENQRLEAVFRRLLARHHSLRTAFVLLDRQPVQRIVSPEELEFKIQRFQLRDRLPEEVIDSFIRPFDLSSAPLLRVGLLELGPQEKLLMLDIHHIVCDARSIELLVEEFATLFRGEEHAPPRLQYTDFALREKRLLESGGMTAARDYWLGQFEGDTPLLNLPLDFERQSRQSFAYEKVESALSPEDTQAAKQLCRKMGEPITMYMLLLAVYALTLSRYSGQEDVVVGSGVSGRNHPDCQRMMGMFVNMLALRCRPREDLTFMEYALQVRRTVLGAFDYQEFPFDELVKRLDIKRQYGRNPLFDAEFTFQQENTLNLDVPGLSIEPFDYQHQLMKFDLSLTAFESGGCLRLIFGYCPELFKRSFIQDFDRLFKELLAQPARNPDILIRELGMPHNLAGGESRFAEQDYIDFQF